MIYSSELTGKKLSIKDIPEGSLTEKGIVKVIDSIDSDDESNAVSINAVKTVYDAAKKIGENIPKNKITVNGMNGTIFTITNSKESVNCSIGESGSTVVEIGGLGECIVNYTYDGKNTTLIFTIDKIGMYSIYLLPPSISFNDDSYETISIISKIGHASSVYAIGDTRAITLNGSLGNGLTLSNYTAYMQILAFDHNSETEMNGESHMVCGFGKSALSGGVDVCFVDTQYNNSSSSQYLNMNTSNTNVGGWASSKMRTVVCPVFQSTLPSDLQAVLRSRTLYTDNTGNNNQNSSSAVTSTTDIVYIPSEFEVHGARTYANSYEKNYQQQLTYYKNGNSKIRYKHNATGTAAYWWVRSAYYNRTNVFCHVRTDGSATGSDADYSYGSVPLITI